MKKIDAYMIVVGSLDQIVDLVNEKIERGWQPFGAITECEKITEQGKQIMVCQPMVQYRADNNHFVTW